MDKVFEDFINLTRETISKKESGIDYSYTDWEKIYQLTFDQKMGPLLFEKIYSIKDKYSIKAEIISNWRHYTVQSIQRENQKFLALQMILNAAEQESLDLIVFKGCILGDLYPQFGLRNTSDSDILAKPQDRHRIDGFFQSLGYKKNIKDSKEQVYIFTNDLFRHAVELHFYLWEDFTGKKIEMLASLDLLAESKIITLTINNQKIRTLGYTEHFIYQIFHIIKHFSVEGIGLRYLIDTIFYYNRYKEQIDLALFWDCMKKMGYLEFCDIFFGTGILYLGLDKDIINKRSTIRKPILEVMLMELINQGYAGSTMCGGYQILGIMTPYFVGDKTISNTKKGRVLQVLFPSADEMRDKFFYARRYSILLPVAWVHRFINFGIYRLKHYGQSYGVSDKIKISQHRIEMMKTFGLVDENK